MYEEIFESIRVAAAKRNLKESTAGAYCRTVKYSNFPHRLVC